MCEAYATADTAVTADTAATADIETLTEDINYILKYDIDTKISKKELDNEGPVIKLVNKPALSWDYLKQFNCKPPNETFPRTPEVVERYKNFKSVILSLYKDFTEYLTEKHFTGIDSKILYKITKNDYPYLLEDGIQHLVCWFNPHLFPKDTESLNDISEKINLIIKKYDYSLELGVNCVYFENLLHARSVPGIRHIHIFIQK